MTLGVVIPVFRAGGRLEGVVDALAGFARESGISAKVVLVEDAGGDDVRAIAGGRAGVTCLVLSGNVGQQRATYLGLAHVADCDLVATMDDDGQHPVDLLGEMIGKIRSGADLCYAVPSRAGLSFFRRVGAVLRDLLFSLSTKKPPGVRVSAYRVMTGTLARKLRPEPDGFIYLSAAAFRHGPKTACVPYRGRPSGRSSYTARKLMRLYGDLAIHYTPLGAIWPGKRRAAQCRVTVYPGKGFL